MQLILESVKRALYLNCSFEFCCNLFNEEGIPEEFYLPWLKEEWERNKNSPPEFRTTEKVRKDLENVLLNFQAKLEEVSELKSDKQRMKALEQLNKAVNYLTTEFLTCFYGKEFFEWAERMNGWE